MSLVFPIEAVRTLVATLTGIPASRVYWSGEAEKMIGPIAGKAGKITLNLVTTSDPESLEPRRTYSATPTPTQTTEWGGTGQATISVRADNFLGHGEAYNTLEKLRFRVRLPSSRVALRAVDLAFRDAPLLFGENLVVDNRDVSRARLDLRLAYLLTETPSGQDGNEGWIEKVSSHDPPDPPSDAPDYDLEFTLVP